MALADYYEGQPVGTCADCGRTLVRVKIGVTPEGEPVWDVAHAEPQPEVRALAS